MGSAAALDLGRGPLLKPDDRPRKPALAEGGLKTRRKSGGLGSGRRFQRCGGNSVQAEPAAGGLTARGIVPFGGEPDSRLPGSPVSCQGALAGLRRLLSAKSRQAPELSGRCCMPRLVGLGVDWPRGPCSSPAGSGVRLRADPLLGLPKSIRGVRPFHGSPVRIASGKGRKSSR